MKIGLSLIAFATLAGLSMNCEATTHKVKLTLDNQIPRDSITADFTFVFMGKDLPVMRLGFKADQGQQVQEGIEFHDDVEYKLNIVFNPASNEITPNVVKCATPKQTIKVTPKTQALLITLKNEYNRYSCSFITDPPQE
ncbi:hypothetical protein Bealeia1_00318 [Candidatus Bealeia paramacronuclearis]|uniref:Uncharacterized protein n=1 Tax=Candidatus Bealeia paramacronuclearis TaxID=1921001 RepID=A0ABZ2C190_9PROT|nr:hypothetical protein [Candidatus Bealeia paramacronuclearis]